jgi:di- and tripeptidase
VHQNDQLFITGANDNTVRVWRVNGMPTQEEQEVDGSENMMITSLREFVSFKTISSRPEFTEDCRKGATYLGSLFKRLGAEVEMLSTGGLHNPIVCAKFSGKLQPAEKRKRILFYGHYDVVPADMKGNNWQTDPFKLEGRDGYLYGRGVSDNKGPIIAALYAVSDLLQAKVLDSDIIFVIEGEEESGSRGFQETIRMHKDLIGHIDYVLLANSYWLDDEVPCLTYGLRGVLHATVCIDSKHPDLHSGVDGSNLLSEPDPPPQQTQRRPEPRQNPGLLRRHPAPHPRRRPALRRHRPHPHAPRPRAGPHRRPETQPHGPLARAQPHHPPLQRVGPGRQPDQQPRDGQPQRAPGARAGGRGRD